MVPSPTIVPKYGIMFNIPAINPSKNPNLTPTTVSPKPINTPIMNAISTCPLKNADIIEANLRAKKIASAFIFGLINSILFSRNSKKSKRDVNI